MSIIVGIVVGTAIFKTPMMVFQNTAGVWQAMGVWLVGGVLSLCGAFCYAELATTYPRDGGDYEYLSRSFGRPIGFLFGWAQLAVVLSASIGQMAYAFADYAAAIWPAAASQAASLAVAAIVALAMLNAGGVVAGKNTQNLLTAAKVLGLGGVVLAGLWAGKSVGHSPTAAPSSGNASLGLAMVFVLYAYGGWNDAAFVAAEVRDQRRNLPRALWIGIFAITIIYLVVNVVYLRVLGFDLARESSAPAADVVASAFGPSGRAAASVLVMLSALAAINGMILAGSRVYAVVGADYPRARWLATWNRQAAVPLAAILVQALVAVSLVLAVGTSTGKSLLDAGLTRVGIGGLPWDEYFGGFETLVAGSAPVFWAFFLLTGLAVFVLRWKDPDTERPFSIPGYPLPPLVFCATSLYMLYSSLAYARWLALLGIVPLALGVPLWWVARRSVGKS